MEWIDVNEKSPSFDKEVLVWNGKHIMLMKLSVIQTTSVGTIFEFVNYGGSNRDITHWMPLPEPPKTIA